MSAQSKTKSRKKKSKSGLSGQRLKEAYRLMQTGRILDNKMLNLLKQGKSFFHIGTSGHEAMQVALGFNMKGGYDWFYPYYRDLTFSLTIGMTPRDVLLQFLSRKGDPASGAKQMPAHYGRLDLRIITQSSPTGTQFLQAVGCAQGSVKEGTDEVVMVSSGEGTTSQGDFHEALNNASRDKLPVVFLVEDNHYAISVPIAQQTAGSVYEMVAGYENLERFQVDGTDFIESYKTSKKAVKRARDGKGPSIIVADLVRLLPHSSSDDHKKYKTPELLEHEKARDPIPKFRQLLIEEEFASQDELDDMEGEIKSQLDEDADWALEQPFPDRSEATENMFAMDFEFPEVKEPKSTGNKIVLVDAINHALHEEMERDEKVLVFGQDLEDGKGGVFTATRGLSTRFGRKRCYNSPLAESTIVGTAVGLATRGFRPVAEIQFGDYIWTSMMQIRNELATIRYRSNGIWSAPAVIRVPVGGYIHGGLYHSQSIDGYFSHIPGLYIVFPSNAADAKGLLKMAVRCPDPVMFLEEKGMYRQQFAAAPEPDEDYLLPFGKARVVREGTDISVITWGALVQRSVEAARDLESEGISVEVVDIRTLVPLDTETIFNSVKKTNKVLVAHEDNLTGGFGGEVASRIADECFMWLDGPIRRLAAKDSHIPYNLFLEEEILPQKKNIVEALRNLVAF